MEIDGGVPSLHFSSYNFLIKAEFLKFKIHNICIGVLCISQ